MLQFGGITYPEKPFRVAACPAGLINPTGEFPKPKLMTIPNIEDAIQNLQNQIAELRKEQDQDRRDIGDLRDQLGLTMRPSTPDGGCKAVNSIEPTTSRRYA